MNVERLVWALGQFHSAPGCFTCFPWEFGHIPQAFVFLTPSTEGKDFFLQSFVPIVNLDSKLIRIQSCVHNTLSRTQLWSQYSVWHYSYTETYPGRVLLPESKDFSYTGQLGLCNIGKEGPVQLDISQAIKTDVVIKSIKTWPKLVFFSTFKILFKDTNLK